MIEDNFNFKHESIGELDEKLKMDPELLKQYHHIIKHVLKQQRDVGIIEKAEDEGKLEETHYLPHRHIIRKDKTSARLRVVFDASSKLNGASLNDCLHKFHL